MGNVTAKDRDDDSPLDVEHGANIDRASPTASTPRHTSTAGKATSSRSWYSTTRSQAHNLFTQFNYQTQWACAIRAPSTKRSAKPAGGRRHSTTAADRQRRISSAGEKLLKYLLFCDEDLITDRIQGTSTFAADFAARGPRDKQGRSLREFDLRRRMFQYPLAT